MDAGATPASPAEVLLYRLQLSVAVSRRMELGSEWHLDLNSPFWRLYVNNRSGAVIVHQGRRTVLRAGQVHLIPAWVRFQTSLERPVIQDFIHFYVTGLPVSLLRRIFHCPLSLSPSPPLSDLCRRWRAGLDAAPEFSGLGWTYALIHAAFALAVESLPGADRKSCLQWLDDSSRIRPALECIDRRLADPPSNRELAGLCHAGTDHFIRHFRAAVGMTPARYGVERRIAIAAQWLTDSSRTIDRIAEEAGFTDRFHFSRVFRTRLGLPPAAYRKLHWNRS